MLFWTIKWTILSVVLILVIHHLYVYFMDTLTFPMNKDLINKPIERYKEMLNTIQSASHVKSNMSLENTTIVPQYSALPSQPSGLPSQPSGLHDTSTMQDELQTFLNELKQDRNKPYNNNNNNNSNNNNNLSSQIIT